MTNNLLDKSKEVYCLFPVTDNKIWEFYKKSISLFWVVEEINLSNDTKDWEKMTKNERYFIKIILSFFASSDGVVSENLCMRFSNEVQLSEARAVYAVQNFVETIHNETYSLLIDSYIKDKDERNECFKAIETMPCIKQKLEWGQKWIDDKESTFSKRLLAFIIVEGLFFSGSFCSIFWLKKRGLMQGLTFSNELISRDEALHTEFGIYLYNTYCDRLEENEFIDMLDEAVKIEMEFITKSLPVRLIGMNESLMGEYIEFCADRLLLQLQYNKLYNTKNPFDFMEAISIDGKTNFFEKRVSEYSLADGGDKEKAFCFDDVSF